MRKKKTYKIFDIDYLQTAELSEDDLYWLCDTPSLTFSLIIEMFRRTKQELVDENKILSLIKNDENWMYRYYWTDKQRKDFEDILKNVYKNIKYCGESEAIQNAQWWVVCYGFTNKELKKNKNMQILD